MITMNSTKIRDIEKRVKIKKRVREVMSHQLLIKHCISLIKNFQPKKEQTMSNKKHHPNTIEKGEEMKTLTEDYVSYETAVLLKEKGFDGECRMTYREHDMQMIYHTPNPNDLFDFTTNRKKLEKYSKKQHCDYALCPTLQMALKWLREVHNWAISIEFQADCPTWKWRIYCIHSLQDRHTNFKHYNSYEEAVEVALKYTLKNLI